ncbi:MAG: metal ABC transporter substrate-binding protein [Myxococcota bacterium]
MRVQARAPFAGALLLLAGPALGCAPAPPTGELVLVATIAPLALVAGELGAGRVRVETLVPAGATPHAFEPRPSDAARLAEAGALLRVGAGLDDWTDSLLAAAPGARVLTLAEIPGLLEEDPDSPDAPDPHVWLDPLRVRDFVAPALVALLVALDPAGAPRYTEQLADFQQRLDALDRELRGWLEAGARPRYVALHPGWRYFAARYGLEEIGTVQTLALEEPTPRSLAALLDAARRERPEVLIVEPQLDPRITELLAEALGTTALRLDPLGDPRNPTRGSYTALIRAAAQGLADVGTP